MGEILVLSMTAIIEVTFHANLHHSNSYVAMAIVVPFLFATCGRATDSRWAATAVAATYTAFMLVTLWVFPLFPAEAKLGPVYQPITHFIPLEFPLLIIAPAFVADLVLARSEAWPRSARAFTIGPLFVSVLVAVQWPFATFLNSEHARNWVFGADYFAYFMHPGWRSTRHLFLPTQPGEMIYGLGVAAITAVVFTYLGLVLGDAMRKVRR